MAESLIIRFKSKSYARAKIMWAVKTKMATETQVQCSSYNRGEQKNTMVSFAIRTNDVQRNTHDTVRRRGTIRQKISSHNLMALLPTLKHA